MKISPRKIDRMIKKLGMKVEPVDNVSYVEIRKQDGEVIHITNPNVVKMNISGQTVFQVTGGEVEIVEEGEAEEVELSEEDISIVAQQAGVDEETARKALITVNGDLIKAIMMLKESQKIKRNGSSRSRRRRVGNRKHIL